MIPDFHNFSLDKCKELIVQYQIDRKGSQFELLLARFDRYILKVVFELQRRWSYLQSEEIQDLYHTGILGFHKAIVAFKPHLVSGFIIPVIKAYIKSEVKQQYLYKEKEILHKVQPMDDLYEVGVEGKHLDYSLAISSVMDSTKLTDEDKELFKLRFCDEQSVKELSEKYHLTLDATYKRISKLLVKIRKLFETQPI